MTSYSETKLIDEQIIYLAEQLAAEFSKEAIARDKIGHTPLKERNQLRESGLLAVTIPKKYGGHGANWFLTFEVIKRFANVDSSLAHLLGYHYLTVSSTFLFGDEKQYAHFYQETAEQNLFWGNAFNPREQSLKAVKENGQILLTGRKSFCSGATDSDRLLVSAQLESSDELILCVLPTRKEGIVIENNWDGFGQRQTDSGNVTFNQVVVEETEILHRTNQNATIFPTIRTHLAQLILTHLLHGLAEGALEESKKYVHTQSRPWLTADVEAAEEDPYIIQQYGEMSIKLRASAALIEKAVLAFEDVWNEQDRLTEQKRGECSLEIAVAKTFAAQAALDITTNIFDVMGARATSNQYKFDRYWRNARTLSLHDPLAYKVRDIGKWTLSNRLPSITPYS
ncbi:MULTISPECIES: acyl-CoA dehydrogenase family protein [Peribacillus]|uniref:acyl-CoA dehydrogenase family protein n=1 Tax=Peribacillus TaxID=2675229 RepID=UPI00203C903B|nr:MULTISPECIES: acyl-CoA dehydrogenase family protein [Peribacillus]MCM3676074.1 acyl-CoA dehydrogenase family protein [Peribacillus simplex]MDQ0884750.1 alkylation response protein AidB-like acyl-CoA dehydrogenase [Peribacillus sp. V2I11]